MALMVHGSSPLKFEFGNYVILSSPIPTERVAAEHFFATDGDCANTCAQRDPQGMQSFHDNLQAAASAAWAVFMETM